VQVAATAAVKKVTIRLPERIPEHLPGGTLRRSNISLS
jgi:hypothetical protein